MGRYEQANRTSKNMRQEEKTQNHHLRCYCSYTVILLLTTTRSTRSCKIPQLFKVLPRNHEGLIVNLLHLRSKVLEIATLRSGSLSFLCHWFKVHLCHLKKVKDWGKPWTQAESPWPSWPKTEVELWKEWESWVCWKTKSDQHLHIQMGL